MLYPFNLKYFALICVFFLSACTYLQPLEEVSSSIEPDMCTLPVTYGADSVSVQAGGDVLLQKGRLCGTSYVTLYNRSLQMDYMCSDGVKSIVLPSGQSIDHAPLVVSNTICRPWESMPSRVNVLMPGSDRILIEQRIHLGALQLRLLSDERGLCFFTDADGQQRMVRDIGASDSVLSGIWFTVLDDVVDMDCTFLKDI